MLQVELEFFRFSAFAASNRFPSVVDIRCLHAPNKRSPSPICGDEITSEPSETHKDDYKLGLLSLEEVIWTNAIKI